MLSRRQLLGQRSLRAVWLYDRAFHARPADEIKRLPPRAAPERAMLDTWLRD
ncbi:hypothetical protein [Mesorhizobium sp.]|uniref:hypothetical protein n=1 Tax=Mesorhizobium sp. TaxID=1871066 RepID=UPI003BAD4599